MLSIILSACSSGASYKTPEEAVRASYANIRKTYPDYVGREYGGVVYEEFGGYVVTFKPTKGGENYVNVAFDRSRKVAAFFHTHPHRPSARFFSPEDRWIGDNYHIPVYMLDPWDQIQQYDWKTHSTRSL